MNNNIRSKVVRESLLDYSTLANSLKENTESAVKSLLDEAVRDTYAKLLSEDDDKDYEEGEVEDTTSDEMPNEAETVEEPQASEGDAEDTADMDSAEELPQDGVDAEGGEEEPATDETVPSEEPTEDDAEDEWADFDKKYKVSDNEYDFSNAEDEDIVKVYKLMQNDDQVFVKKSDDNKVNVQDNETGAEYIIDLGNGSGDAAQDGADGFGAEDEFQGNENDMNESTERLFELVLEYNSNLGYTDNYQGKDVMTNDGMAEPGKNVNDWDKGTPKGTEKPWSGYPSKKNKADKPFNGPKGKQVEENVSECGDMPMQEGDDIDSVEMDGAVNELKTNAEHSANVGSTSRTDGPNNPRKRKGRNFHTAQGGQVTGTGDNPYGNGVEESLMKKINKALKENKELKNALGDVMKSLKEAAVTNHNLAQIIKLISENTTTRDEKKEIIERFMKEAKTIDESKALFNTISRDLKKAKKMDITESVNSNLSVEGSKKINETTIYKSKDLLDSLDLMHRMMK